MSGRYKAYGEYKDSGVDSIGFIPQNWSFLRLKYITEIKKRIAGELGYDVLSVTQKGIVIKDIVSGEGQLSMDYSKYQIVYSGEFAMNHMDLLTGYVDISKYNGVTSPDYRVFAISNERNFYSRYYLYLLQDGYKQRRFFHLGQGSAHFGRWRLPTEAFNEICYPSPSFAEQTQIATFLDHETAKIDTLIDKQQQLIELLIEKRQAVISHAVTKGLDPDVPMKDSGVEWLGEVPEHWVIYRLKILAKIKNGQDYKLVESERGYPVIGSGGQFSYSTNFLYNKESVLLGRKGTIDKPLYIKEPFWTVDTMYYTEVYESNHVKYIYYLALTIQFSRYSTNTALPSMTQENLGNYYFSVPKLKIEQTQIAAFLDHETAKIDTLIELQQQQIELLKERRTALISAAVTGKIDVRDWQVPATRTESDEVMA
jgi:type I restriction enzyme S subunit